MSRIDGFQTCPRCKKQSLPRIDTDSLVLAVRCWNCGEIIERAELEAEPKK
jgi:transcription elongation factor Elf1